LFRFRRVLLAYWQSVCPPTARLDERGKPVDNVGVLPIGGPLGGLPVQPSGSASIWIAYAGSWAAYWLFSPRGVCGT
jgi:hypothetical protein